MNLHGLRSFASFAVVMIAGYLSLATSCEESDVVLSAQKKVRFEKGARQIRVEVEFIGTYALLWTDVADVKWGPDSFASMTAAGGMGGTVEESGLTPFDYCDQMPNPDLSDPVTTEEIPPQGCVLAGSAPSKFATLEIWRDDPTSEMELTLWANVYEYGTCSGSPPDKLGLRMVQVE